VLRRVKAKIVYVYDFGDNWQHDVVLEKVLPAEPGAKYPQCTGGKRACPPDDSGGPWGYARYLEALAAPTKRGNREFVEWIGEDWDPEAFSAEAVNRIFRRVG
jgi:hypothetical protein